MTELPIESFEEFWTFYVREHASKTNRRLHFVGTSLAMGLVGYGIARRKLWPLVTAPIVGYGAAWVGHFFVEGNRPASFKYPLWSFKADMKMWSMIATGKMDSEVERVMQKPAENSDAKENHTNGVTA